MKKITLIIFLISSIVNSQTLKKTYHDPYSRTKLKEVYQVKKNTPILNGYYKLYDEYGNILRHLHYLDNKLNGKQTTYVGTYQATITYGGEKNIGQIFTISYYKNGLLNGTELRYNFKENGNKYLEFKKTYKNGELIKFIEFYKNKKFKSIIQIGTCTEFYENGSKYAEYRIDKNGKAQGKYTQWYQSGQINGLGNFLDDEKNGEWIIYNEDGTIETTDIYIKGKKQPSEKEKLEELKRIEIQKEKELELKKQQEEQRKKDIEEKKKRNAERKEYEYSNKISELKEELYREKSYLEQDYKYWDNDKYSYEKPKLYNKYITVIKFLKEDLTAKTLHDQVLIYELCISLTKRMENLLEKNTRKLEKEISKIDDIQQIIDKILK